MDLLHEWAGPQYQRKKGSEGEREREEEEKGSGEKKKKKVFLFIFQGGALLRLLLCSLSLLVFGILLEIKEDSVEVI